MSPLDAGSASPLEEITPEKAKALKKKKPIPEHVKEATKTWTELGLRCNADGYPHTNVENAIRILQHYKATAQRLWYDTFLQRVLTTWGSKDGTAQEWSDELDILLTASIQTHLYLPKLSLENVRNAVLAVAWLNKRNECLEWLQSLKWDKQERLRDLLPLGFGTVDDDYHQSVGRCWMVSIVARVMEPGCKVDTMPIFEGKQGLRKSSALAVLGGKWFTECHEDIFNKDFYGVLEGKMIVEIAEMHAFSKADVNRIKGIISCRVDRYRNHYGRRTTDHYRQSVFAGTTNADDWNRDETGARRFWPVACTAIDLPWLEENRDQLFAEAVARKNRDEIWWDFNEAEATRQQDLRRELDSWEPPIANYVRNLAEVTTANILLDCFRIELADNDYKVQRRVATIMKQSGWKCTTPKDENRKTFRLWINPAKR